MTTYEEWAKAFKEAEEEARRRSSYNYVGRALEIAKKVDSGKPLLPAERSELESLAHCPISQARSYANRALSELERQEHPDPYEGYHNRD